MKKNQLVYIILVNYNGLEDTVACLESLQKIEYDNYKIIIVDNCSEKEVKLENYDQERIEIIRLNYNLGFAGGNNVGIKRAKEENAKYVLLLNNDTVVEKDFLKELVEIAENDKEIGSVGGKINYFDQPNLIWYAGGKINSFTGKTKHIGVNEIDNGQYNEIRETEYITGCMMLIPLEVIEKVGMMEEDYFLYYEETDWNVRIKNAGYKIVYNYKAKIYHKISSSTKKINDIVGFYYDRNSYYFIQRNYGEVNKMFMWIYMRGFLLLKYFKYILLKRDNKCKIIKNTYRSIKKQEMGKYEF